MASVIVVPVAPWDGMGSDPPNHGGRVAPVIVVPVARPPFSRGITLTSLGGGYVWHSRFFLCPATCS